ncbi:uncharacterized protein K02A2.6-like [Malaya genurostris]|uniref:uncharacterized protein K02A2.6-like n=1 Tax=Malaya genurostris TaxID=325434 RepID=UPI0026F3EAF2|nr:uncharacterized protein K02A2.6-like [Malaya genurostris]
MVGDGNLLDGGRVPAGGAVAVASIAMQSTFTVEPFDRHKMKWSRWVERLEGAFLLFGVRDDAKLPMLLHYMGAETYDVVSDKLAPEKPQTKTYDEIVQTLENHFNPEPLEILENFRFKCRKQCDERADESIDDYLIALRKLAITCNFGNYLSTALRNQFVFGIKDRGIQARLLEVRGLTLDRAREIAVSMEASAKGGQEIHSRQGKPDLNLVEHPPTKPARGKVNKKFIVSEKKTKSHKHPDTKRSECFRCGSVAHFANKCPHIKTTCNYCNVTGHLQKVCLKKKSAENKKSDSHQVEESATNKVKQASLRADEICGIYDAADFNNNADKFRLELLLNGSKVIFEIDSGSPVSILSLSDYQKYIPGIKMHHPDTTLVSYSGNTIELFGMCAVHINYGGKNHELLLYVAKNKKHPLLGRGWMKVLKIDVNKFYENVHTIAITNCAESVKRLIERYGSVCEKSMGKIEGLTAKLQLKPNVQPVYLRARSVPFSIRQAVENEIKSLENDGVLVKVNHSAWATPVVPVMKLNNRVRLCGDYKISVNPNLVVDEHPLPTVEELFANVAGGEKFTKIDLSQAYLQLEVSADDQEILTLSTHLGLYRPTRLMYGISSAPAIWQRLMEEVLNGIPGVTVFLDDIRVTGPNDQVHLQRLEEVMKRLCKYNMRINLDKCQFFADRIEYCGYLIDRDGIHKVRSKIDAMQNMPVPENKDQVRSFVGLVNYYGRFFPHLSTTIYPLNRLLRNNVTFKWTKESNDAFLKVKEEMQSERFLVHYSTELPLILATDASPYGVGAVLSHIMPDGTERPIMYASKTLNDTQRRYKQIDREAFAIIFGVRKFYQYLYGRKFLLVTDNEPVKQIFSETKGLPAMSALRMQHYATFLASFRYVIKFRPTKEHYNADAFSRLPVSTKTLDNVIEEVDLLEVNIIETLPIRVEDLAKSTAMDSTVKILLQGLKNGKTVDARDRFGIDQIEFALQQGCIMRGIRVYVPPELRPNVLKELHSTHFGTTRLKSLARGYVWWERIDKDIEELVRNCASCQMTRPEAAKVPLHCWETPKEPFERVHVDFAGPFMGTYFIVFVDAYTKWPEVKILRDITTSTTIHACREFFAAYGIPAVLVSDHGVQFTSAEFQKFLKLNGIFHKMGAPYHPATNGQAERFIQTFKSKMKALNCDKSRMHTELCNILLSYRKTIHPATGKSPSMLLFNRQIRSRLDLMIPTATSTVESPHVNVKCLPEGTRVAARDYLDKDKWKYGHITERLGKLHYHIQLDDGRVWKLHIDQLREVGENLQPKRSELPAVRFEADNLPFVHRSSTSTSEKHDPVSISGPAENPLVESQSSRSIPATTGPSVSSAKATTSIPTTSAKSDHQQQSPRRSTRIIKPPRRLNL